MAKAQFHRNQKVWVSTVGTWATIEKIVPVWAKGFGEPVRITYDVGLGREFLAAELQPEDDAADPETGEGPGWRVLRARNKWQEPEDFPHHPFPGTYPVVVTDPQDWGGWRVPGAEYDRDPVKIEIQARLVAAAPRLLAICRELHLMVDEAPEDAPPAIRELAERCGVIIRDVTEVPAAPGKMQPEQATAA